MPGGKMRWFCILLLTSILAMAPAAEALEIMGGDVVNIDSPIADDLFAGGNTVNINAPVDSAFIAGGNVFVNAPIKGDLVVAGGVIELNSDVGGKVVAAGGTINLRGDVERNVVMAGGQVRVHPASEIGRDAALSGSDVYNAGTVRGTLWVSARSFENPGSAGAVKFQRWQEGAIEGESKAVISTFSLLMILGFLIVGLLALRLSPGSVSVVDRKIRESAPVRALLGFVLIVASSILIVISILTVVGLPLGFLLLALFVAALILADVFVSYSLGRWALSTLNQDRTDLTAFVLGYTILSVLFLLPYAGPVIKLISVSLGFGGIVAALDESRRRV